MTFSDTLTVILKMLLVDYLPKQDMLPTKEDFQCLHQCTRVYMCTLCSINIYSQLSQGIKSIFEGSGNNY